MTEPKSKAEEIMDAIEAGEVKEGASRPKELFAKIDTAVLFEQLADIEHQKWADWHVESMGRLERLEDGRLVIPVEYEAALRGLIETPFADLDEKMKDADRREVARYWGVIEAYVAGLE